MGTDPWGFSEERQALARKLVRTRRRYSWAHTGVLVAFLFVLLAGGSAALRNRVLSVGLPGWAATTLFLVVLYAVGSALGWPFAYIGGYRADRAFGLSTQSPRSWALDQLKSFALGLGATVLAGGVLLWLLATQPGWWWAIAWALGIAVTSILGFLAPVLLAPIFFRFRPLQDAVLRARYEALAARAGVPVIGVFEMGASAKTRRSNAAVVGFGRTRRIVVTDTMLRDFTADETESVLAHELGHQRNQDLLKGVLVGAAFSLVMWSVAGWAYGATSASLGFRSIADMAGLPLLLLWSGIVTTAMGPLELWWSRRRESRADRFSLEVAGNPAAFASAMVKLADGNLGVSGPRPWETWLLHSHPPARERVEAARSFGNVPPPRR